MNVNSVTEDSLTQFFNLSYDLMCIINVDGRIERVSPSFIKELGYTQSDLLSKPIYNFIHVEDLPSAREEIDNIIDGNKGVRFPFRMVHKKGHEVDICWKAILSYDEKRIYAIGRICQ